MRGDPTGSGRYYAGGSPSQKNFDYFFLSDTVGNICINICSGYEYFHKPPLSPPSSHPKKTDPSGKIKWPIFLIKYWSTEKQNSQFSLFIRLCMIQLTWWSEFDYYCNGKLSSKRTSKSIILPGGGRALVQKDALENGEDIQNRPYSRMSGFIRLPRSVYLRAMARWTTS